MGGRIAGDTLGAKVWNLIRYGPFQERGFDEIAYRAKKRGAGAVTPPAGLPPPPPTEGPLEVSPGTRRAAWKRPGGEENVGFVKGNPPLTRAQVDKVGRELFGEDWDLYEEAARRGIGIGELTGIYAPPEEEEEEGEEVEEGEEPEGTEDYFPPRRRGGMVR
jgi:hypothetical protein